MRDVWTKDFFSVSVSLNKERCPGIRMGYSETKKILLGIGLACVLICASIGASTQDMRAAQLPKQGTGWLHSSWFKIKKAVSSHKTKIVTTCLLLSAGVNFYCLYVAPRDRILEENKRHLQDEKDEFAMQGLRQAREELVRAQYNFKLKMETLEAIKHFFYKGAAACDDLRAMGVSNPGAYSLDPYFEAAKRDLGIKFRTLTS